jgi:hypothetical protein
VRFAQVISSGFGEVDEGKDLQAELVNAAKAGGMRLLGPNCLGIYTPRGSVTFAEIGPKEVGHVGIVSQSGGLGTDIIRRGLARGLKFSGLVTVGNCADVTPGKRRSPSVRYPAQCQSLETGGDPEGRSHAAGARCRGLAYRIAGRR